MASRALVLGGGGVTGVAWELGILAGLVEAGIDLLAADLIVGTSAGSVVAAQIASGVPLDDLYQRQLEPPGSEIAARMGLRTILAFTTAGLTTRDQQKARAKIGAMALATQTMPEADRRAVIEARLPTKDWPQDRKIIITAVAADNGEFFPIDKDSGVSLVDAVGASCAVPGVWPPVTINGRRYVDGGVRSPANVDLAAGYERVVVVAPITFASRRSLRVRAQVAALPDAVAITLTPDPEAARAIGRNVLDPARRVGSAQAGHRQAALVADAVKKVWATES
jgi:NTE family protein